MFVSACVSSVEIILYLYCCAVGLDLFIFRCSSLQYHLSVSYVFIVRLGEPVLICSCVPSSFLDDGKEICNQGVVVHEILGKESIDLGLSESFNQYFYSFMCLPWSEEFHSVFDYFFFRGHAKLLPKVIDDL